jgi:DNA-directed RNA polymerase subunit RPC12/RpoP
MTKAEMESHRAAYQSKIASARNAHAANAIPEAIAFALASWDHIDGMVQYERRYNGAETIDIEGIQMVMSLSPFIFDSSSLDKLEVLLKNQRRIGKCSKDNLASQLVSARVAMWQAHHVWSVIEQEADATEQQLLRRLEWNIGELRPLLSFWGSIGLLRRSQVDGSWQLGLSTRMSELILAKCPACGVQVKAPKVKLLDAATCPKCRGKVLFVLIPIATAIAS